MHFCIVTPCLNVAHFIDETILHVVSQAGRFSIRFHVQDGGSTDGTLEKLARWQWLLSGRFPLLCDSVDFTYASAADSGMYSAIKAGFDRCGEGDAMAWINADDRFEPGAFQLVADLLDMFRDIDWLCGRGTILDEKGTALSSSPIVPFPRNAIAAGIFDGRYWPCFIQQEGTFWRQQLWLATGGVNADFRLAGDFDLWRRFARHTDLVMVDAVLGCFRRRKGQATSNLAEYYAEIDGSMTPGEKNQRAAVKAAYARAAPSPRALRSAGFSCRLIKRRDTGEWVCKKILAIDQDMPVTLREVPLVLLSVRRRLPRHWSVRRLLRQVRAVH